MVNWNHYYFIVKFLERRGRERSEKLKLKVASEREREFTVTDEKKRIPGAFGVGL